jgi:DNA-binding Lrp family transcriptional regulator
MSVQAFILIQTEVGKATGVADAVAKIAGVTLSEGVTGPYDVIMRAEAPSMEEFGRLVLSKVQAVPGITRTLTCPVTHLS